MHRTKQSIVVLMGLGLLGLSGCTTPPDQIASPAKTPEQTQRAAQLMSSRETLTATAIVARVDTAQRQLVLKGNRGRMHPMRADDSVSNLERFKAGDRVELRYHEALLLELERAPSGPIVSRTLPPQESEMNASVAAINQKTRKVTLRGERDTITMKAAPELNIRSLKTGERVRVRYLDARVLEIRPFVAQKKTKPRR